MLKELNIDSTQAQAGICCVNSSGPLAPRYTGPERRSVHALPGVAGDFLSAETWSPRLLALMLDEVDYGMLLLNTQAQVIHTNHAARSEMDDTHPLRTVAGCLRARSQRDSGSLTHALLVASRDHRRCLLTLGQAERRLMVAVVPLRSGAAGHQDHANGRRVDEVATLLVFGKRQVCESLSVQWFAQQHHLTLAESQVLQAVCSGAAPGEVARKQGVAVSTVRTQISSIRAKTGASSLRELVRLVAVLPPLLSALRQG